MDASGWSYVAPYNLDAGDLWLDVCGDGTDEEDG
jgi:hypothetical protein